MTHDTSLYTAIPILQVAQALGLHIVHSGGGDYIPCPFTRHENDPRNPRCQIGGAKNIAYCHKCSVSADTVGLVKAVLDCDAAAAFHWLDEHFHVSRNSTSARQRSSSALPASLPAIRLPQAISRPEDPAAIAALTAFADYRKWSADSMLRFGCTAGGEHVFFPMYDAQGVRTGTKRRRVDGRQVDGEAKEKTNPGGHAGLAVPSNFPDKGVVLVCEGQTGAIAVHSTGHPAVLGTAGASASPAVLEYLAAFCATRDVVLLPDRDKAGKSWTRKLAESLSEVAASLKIAQVTSHGDIDDLLFDCTDSDARAAALSRVIESADAAEKPISGESRAVPPSLIAAAISESEHFAQDAGGRLYYYRDGSYRPRGETFVHRKAKEQLAEWNMTDKWTSYKGRETAEYIRLTSEMLLEQPPPHIINQINGLLSLNGDAPDLRPHDPAHLCPVQLPVVYDPAARSPKIDEFLSQIAEPDSIPALYQLAGVLMVPGMFQDKAVLLLGDGANGKSTFLRLLTAFLGKSNVSAIPLHRLESDKFATARLCGKLANIAADLPSEHLAGTSVFKAVTGGDSVLAEYKFADSFDFTPFCRLVFSANTPPQAEDDSHGFFRRWIVIPFNRTFEGADARPQEDLLAELTSPAELSGFLNQAIKALRLARETNSYNIGDSMRDAWQDFRATTDPLAVWLDKHTVTAIDAMIPCSELHNAYMEYAQRKGRARIGKSLFGIKLKRLRPEVESCQRTYSGTKRRWVYDGIALNDNFRDNDNESVSEDEK